jgi:hypothetical protein
MSGSSPFNRLFLICPLDADATAVLLPTSDVSVFTAWKEKPGSKADFYMDIWV